MLQTRASFFANGLVPVTPSADQAQEECSICTMSFTNPVKLSCSHTFCKACVVQWLNMKGKNTCPSCRHELFALPQDESLTVSQNRQARVTVALRTSGLVLHGTPRHIDTFGSTEFQPYRLQRATASAVRFLAEYGSVAQLVGPAIIEPTHLSPYFVAMGNLIPAFAAAEGREYTHDQRQDWRALLLRLWPVVAQRKSTPGIDAMVMPGVLSNALHEKMGCVEHNITHLSFFENNGDLQTHLNYLTHCARQRHEEKAGAQRMREARARDRRRGVCIIM